MRRLFRGATFSGTSSAQPRLISDRREDIEVDVRLLDVLARLLEVVLVRLLEVLVRLGRLEDQEMDAIS